MSVFVVGVDPSLTSTGLARYFNDPLDQPGTRTVKSAPSDGTLHGRSERIREIVATVVDWCAGAELVVIEGPSFHSKGAGTWDRAWNWGSIVTALLEEGHELMECPPTSRALFATGKGNAPKDAVVAAMARLFPDIDLTGKGPVNDQLDGLALACVGAAKLGWGMPFEMPTYRHRALEKLTLG